VVGSINMDLVSVTRRIPAAGETVLGSDFQTYPGGKGANQAVAIARLGYPVQLIGRLGGDAFGDQLRAQLRRVGVDISGIATSEGSSGVAIIVVSAEGENSIVVTPGANAKLTPQDLEANIAMIRNAGLVLTQLETPLETVECLATICEREHVPLILDPAPAMELPQSIFGQVAWFTPNETEAAFFIQRASAIKLDPAAISKLLLAKGCHGVVLKMGSHGVYLASGNDIAASVPAFRVKAIDTTAAGDAFNGGFATGLMLGKSAAESAHFAAAVAALSVTRSGAQSSMPSRAEVDTFVENAAISTS
jgi:ribokinase